MAHRHLKLPDPAQRRQPSPPLAATITAQDIEAWARVERALAGKAIDMRDLKDGRWPGWAPQRSTRHGGLKHGDPNEFIT